MTKTTDRVIILWQFLSEIASLIAKNIRGRGWN
jgi:hypothetical protein